ncbi:hypothetical protein CR152_16390 [Massilia violaceinigra]|uniref:DUF29 domain-containing protein n=1 Tax=Massilia violaceinigra TaxID=2045208 RepID=A0A2D2DLU6_9BURK|nr:DUF29 domain-containing protein [Massilia violaceinigra]ATQ75935.1 hypothetical protein CR152_16390 [Massilia violaceinigra]
MDRIEVPRGDYQEDFVLWLERQAELLRAGKFELLDVDHLIDELEGAVRADRRELEGYLENITAYLLSLQYRPRYKPRHWRIKLGNARFGMGLLIDDSPSLVFDIAELAALNYDDARRRAAWETRLPESIFPAALPYSAAELLDDDFDPSYPPDEGS